MHRIGVYAVSLIAASMICAVLQALMPAGGRKQILRIICGVFLLLTLLTPLSGVRLPDLSDYLAGFRSEGEAAAAVGQEMALTERQELIILGLQSYILDKAAALGFEPEVSITLDPEGVPTAVTLEGSFTPSQQEALRAVLQDDLGIAKEDQQWMSRTQPGT